MGSRLVVIRHPKPEVAAGLCYGQLDLPLAEEFSSPRSSALRATLSSLALRDSRIYASPSQRCRLPAEALSFGPVCVDARLMEMHFGAWEGRAWESIDRAETDPWIAALASARVPNGESFQDLTERVAAFLRDLPMDRDALVFSHAGVIRRLLCWQKNATLEEAFAIAVAYESCWEFSLADLQTKIES